MTNKSLLEMETANAIMMAFPCRCPHLLSDRTSPHCQAVHAKPRGIRRCSQKIRRLSRRIGLFFLPRGDHRRLLLHLKSIHTPRAAISNTSSIVGSTFPTSRLRKNAD
ncbi:MAG: hypothetical protein OEV77_12315 [Nitrospira sp.]|nr:hypothetical protein [Nitrospira sp.]